MRSLLGFIKRTWLLFLLLFIAPGIVIALFAVNEYIIHSIDLTAGDWANLMGCVFSYWGTILLGTLAFWQNDRIMQLEERNAEIHEIELRIKNTPDFTIDSISLSFGNQTEESKLQLVSVDSFEYREAYQSEVYIQERICSIALYIVLNNSTNASAHNVEVYESMIDQELKNGLFTMGSHVHKIIDKQGSVALCYYVRFDETKPRNDVKFAEYSFNLNYENIFHHNFNNKMKIFVGIESSVLSVFVGIGPQHNKKIPLEPKSCYHNTRQ